MEAALLEFRPRGLAFHSQAVLWVGVKLALLTSHRGEVLAWLIQDWAAWCCVFPSLEAVVGSAIKMSFSSQGRQNAFSLRHVVTQGRQADANQIPK